MPAYDFICGGCGTFELRRPIEDAAAPATCPTCGAQARRRFAAPGLRRVPTALRTARDWADRSAHEPAVVTEKRGRPMPHLGHGHAH